MGHLTASRPCNQAMPVRPTPAIRPTAIAEIKPNIERLPLLVACRSIAHSRHVPGLAGALLPTPFTWYFSLNLSPTFSSIPSLSLCFCIRLCITLSRRPPYAHQSTTTCTCPHTSVPVYSTGIRGASSSSFGTTQASHGVAGSDAGPPSHQSKCVIIWSACWRHDHSCPGCHHCPS